MSLKAFHIFFIAVSTVFFFSFGTWMFLSASQETALWMVAGGVACFVAGGLLILYAMKFLKKFKHISFM